MKILLRFFPVLVFFVSSFTLPKKNKLKLPDEYAHIPAGHVFLFNPEEKKLSNKVVVEAFHMLKTEITNQQYQQFYNEVAEGLAAEEKSIIACDSTAWSDVVSYGEPLVNNYYRHPAYKNYPVVNISHTAALKYCAWLQQKLQKENPAFNITVALPSKEQWIHAAEGGRKNAMYPWGNFYMRNNRGQFLCNFRRIGDQCITRNRETGKPEIIEASGNLKDNAYYTADVKSYFPNDYGLYNMCGNVSEMITEKGTALGGSWNDYGGDVLIRSETSFEKVAPTIGFRPVIMVKEKTKS
jgi:formylglycine-generating enzyme required for sulfatase activity